MAVLASALGCGLLMGIERERRKGDGPFRSLAGVRSFALAALSGAAAALIGSPALVAVVGVFIAALAVTAYARDRSGDPGVTTEILEWQRISLPDLRAWTDATPYFGTMHQRHFGDRGQAEWLEGLMDELVRSGAARREGDVLVNI